MDASTNSGARPAPTSVASAAPRFLSFRRVVPVGRSIFPIALRSPCTDVGKVRMGVPSGSGDRDVPWLAEARGHDRHSRGADGGGERADGSEPVPLGDVATPC